MTYLFISFGWSGLFQMCFRSLNSCWVFIQWQLKLHLWRFLQIKVELFIFWWECLNTDKRVLIQTDSIWDQTGLTVYLFLCPQVRDSMNLTDVLSPCQPQSQVEVNLNPPVRRWPLCPNPSSTGWVTRNNAHMQHCCWKVVFVPFFMFKLSFLFLAAIYSSVMKLLRRWVFEYNSEMNLIRSNDYENNSFWCLSEFRQLTLCWLLLKGHQRSYTFDWRKCQWGRLFIC